MKPNQEPKPDPKAKPAPAPAPETEVVQESKSTLEIKSNSLDIRIYIDGLLHVRFPRDKNIKIHSWIDGSTKLCSIEIWTVGHPMTIQYDNKELWTEILKLLDKHI